MTLDALFQLMKIISPSETPSDGDLANFMTMLISTKNHSDALLPFSQRAYMLSVAYRDPQKAAALLSSCQRRFCKKSFLFASAKIAFIATAPGHACNIRLAAAWGRALKGW